VDRSSTERRTDSENTKETKEPGWGFDIGRRKRSRKGVNQKKRDERGIRMYPGTSKGKQNGEGQ